MKRWISTLGNNPDLALARANYRALAAGYDASCHGITNIRKEAIAALLLQPGDIVADVACGTGATLPLLAEAVGEDGLVIGIEASADMAALARQRIATHPLGHRIRLIESDVADAQLGAQPVALLFSFTHDVLQSKVAVDNLVAQSAPGARVALAGIRWHPWWWAAPLNLWTAWSSRRCRTTVRGLGAPWQLLAAHCTHLAPKRHFFLGTCYLASGSLHAQLNSPHLS